MEITLCNTPETPKIEYWHPYGGNIQLLKVPQQPNSKIADIKSYLQNPKYPSRKISDTKTKKKDQIPLRRIKKVWP